MVGFPYNEVIRKPPNKADGGDVGVGWSNEWVGEQVLINRLKWYPDCLRARAFKAFFPGGCLAGEDTPKGMFIFGAS